MQALLIVYTLAAAIAWAGSQNSATAGPLPVFTWCALVAFGMQWLAFVPAYLKQTEVFYDLTGSLTYISCTLLALWLAGHFDVRSLLLTLFIMVWAVRLGSFLFARIRQDGSDDRFDKIKPDPIRFFTTWSLQGLWVLLTAGAALAAVTSVEPRPLSALDLIGAALWVTGFSIEVIADRQKRAFRRQHGSGEDDGRS